ncbi:MAG: NUDIX hydrolase [Clostridia bacterium]|nr:NUDIX hydrolase [Clostridia bacterium]MBQ3076589.1 NUDIX hydrolase [Clostridia bacterium]
MSDIEVRKGESAEFFERRTATEPIFKGRIIDVRRDTVELVGGHTTTREVVSHVGGVGIVALDKEDNVLLVRQYRYPIGAELIEIPAGTLGRGEDPGECGIRELWEETGAVAGRFTSLGSTLSSPGFSDQRIYLYLAEELSFGQGQLDEDEFLSVFRMPLAELVDRILSGEIDDGKTVAGVLKVWALRHRK